MKHLIIGGSSLLLICLASCTDSTGPKLPLSATVTPSSGGIGRCNSVQLALALSDRDGGGVMADSVRWLSNDPNAASVSSAGLVHALANSPGVIITGTGYAFGSSASAQATFTITSTSNLPCP
jgi:uncharacterized protein YjdB